MNWRVRYSVVLLILMSLSFFTNAKETSISIVWPDSIKTTENIQLKAEKLIHFALDCSNSDTGKDSSYHAAFEAYQLFNKLNFVDDMFYSLTLAGSKAFYGEHKEKGIWCFTKCQQILERYPNKISANKFGLNIYDASHYLAIYYKNINSAKYLYYLEKGIENARKVGDHKTISWLYNQYTVYYFDMKKPDLALEYSQRAYAETFSIKDSMTMLISLMNIGDALTMVQKCNEANKMLRKAQNLEASVKGSEWEYWLKEAIANNYLIWGKLDKSELYFKEALAGFEKLSKPNGIAITKGRYARLLYREGKTKEAFKNRNEAFEVAEKSDLLFASYLIYDNIIWAFEDLNMKDSANHYKDEFMRYKGSMLRKAYEKQANSLMKLEDIQENRYKLDIEAQNLQKEIKEKKSTNNILLIGVSGTGALLILIFWSYNRRHKSNEELRKRNKLIVNQKNLLEQQIAIAKDQEQQIKEAHSELKGSLEYAKHIQRIILPSLGILKNTFSDAATWYRPKEIVSGDFNWIYVKENVAHVAIADCSGEGVAAAMVSMLGYNGLNSAVREFHEHSAEKIVFELNQFVNHSFYRSRTQLADPIRIAYTKINLTDNTISFCGAKLGIFIRHKGEVSYHKGENIFIGNENPEESFVKIQFELDKGDELYFFTSSFIKQANIKHREFGVERLLDLLNDIGDLHIEDQKNAINQRFTDWKGKQDQTGDVCVMAIRL